MRKPCSICLGSQTVCASETTGFSTGYEETHEDARKAGAWEVINRLWVRWKLKMKAGV